ncbi:MAG: hypothetical protein ACT4PT_14300 [Methanobacteriota archaeon]
MEATGREGRLRRAAKWAFWIFVSAFVVQSIHVFEHVVQLHQLIWLADPEPLGLFGHLFNNAVWVHFAYNISLGATLLVVFAIWRANPGIWQPSPAGARWFTGLILFQGVYHVIEHVIQLYQHYTYSMPIPPGWIGKQTFGTGRTIPNIVSHFDINAVALILMAIVLWHFRPRPEPYAAASAARAPEAATAPRGERARVRADEA